MTSLTTSINTTRRSRGYNFEHKIVQEFSTTTTAADGWQCRRMGGTSTGMPDTVAVNNIHDILLAIECKSTTGNYCYVPVDQLERCNNLLNLFNRYGVKHIVLAFKFSGNKGSRKLRHYYWVLPEIHEDLSCLHSLRCDYNGIIMSIDDKILKQKCMRPKQYDFLNYHSFSTDKIESLKKSLKPFHRTHKIETDL